MFADMLPKYEIFCHSYHMLPSYMAAANRLIQVVSDGS